MQGAFCMRRLGCHRVVIVNMLFLTAFPPRVSGRIRDWQYPLEPSALRSSDGRAIITDAALLAAAALLQPYAHLVCSWTGAQLLSRAGLTDPTRTCGSLVARSQDFASDAASMHACAHLLSWSPVNHYPLLALLASRLPLSAVVVEIGTMHGAAAFALRAGLDEGCRLKGFSAIDCPSVVITYNVVDDSAHNAKDCGTSKDAWMQVKIGSKAFKFINASPLRP